MQEYFLDMSLEEGQTIELPADKAHHAFQVLKLHHETVRLVSNDAGYFAEVYRENGKNLARILQRDSNVNELATDVTLCMALIRREKFELVLQKAAELGVRRIVPFESSRCVVKSRKEKQSRVRERWQAILIEAAEQCKRNRIPECSEVADIKDLSAYKSEVSLVPYEKTGEHHKRIMDFSGSSVTVAIGPEGGFSDAEIKLLEQEGYEPVNLGSRILRAETAAIYSCAVIAEVFR